MLSEELRAQGWIEHDGGPCPVGRTAEVSVLYDNAWQARNVGYGLDWKWAPRIIAYKPETPDA